MNIEDKVPNLHKRLEHLGSHFEDYACVIFENDSKDNTRTLLKQMTSTNKKIHLLECPEAEDCKLKAKKSISNGTASPVRMKMMSAYRNKLIKYIIENFKDYDCVCFLDLDIKGPINIDGVAHSFYFYNAWDSVSAFGITGISLTLGVPVYYDMLAFNDRKLIFNEKLLWLNLLPNILKLKDYKIGDDLIPVKSGFCGLAFYKMDVFLSGVDYTPADGDYKCEHLILHDNMEKKGFDRIFIDPNLVILVGVQGNSDVLPNY